MTYNRDGFSSLTSKTEKENNMNNTHMPNNDIISLTFPNSTSIGENMNNTTDTITFTDNSIRIDAENDCLQFPKSIPMPPTSIPTNLLLAILYFVGKYGAETLIKSIIELNKTNITLDDITNLQSTIKRPEDYFKR